MSDLGTLSKLYRTTQKLGLEDDLDSLLDEVLEQARSLIGFDHCAVLLHEPDSNELVVRHALGFDEDVLGLRLEIGEGICGWAAEHGRSTREGDVVGSWRYVPGLEAARSNLAVPLVLENQLVGVINVESRRPHAFTEEHEMLLTILGTKAALAIVASRTQHDLKQKLDLLDALYRISTLSTAKKSFEEVLSDVIDEAQKSLPQGDLAILLLDDEGHRLVLRHRGGYPDHVEGMHIPIEKGIAGRCARTGEAQLVDDVSRDPDYIRGVRGARSQLTVPLIVEGAVSGVLIAESRRPAAYTAEDLRFATVIAGEIASVLATTKLKEEAQRLAVTDSLTGLSNRRHFHDRVSEDLRAATRYEEEMALLLIDLDHFKSINDTHGHPTGDRVLAAVGACLAAAARAGDQAARIGGEEFAVLLRRCAAGQAHAAAQRILGAIRELRVDAGDDTRLEISASVGIALFPRHGDTFTALFAAADAALYSAKASGRDCIALLADDDIPSDSQLDPPAGASRRAFGLA